MGDDTSPVTFDGMTTEETVAGWWEYWRRFTGNRVERKGLELGEPAGVVRAHDFVEDLVDRGGGDALLMITALIDAAPGDDALATVGCGPLENFMHECDDALVDQVEQLARRSRRFRAALRYSILPNRLRARFASMLGC